MNADRNSKQDDAREQVTAFMALMKEEHGLDDEKFRRITTTMQKNGKMYVTWAWVLSILLALVGFLSIRHLSSIETRLSSVEAKQADVRERLLAVETLLRQYMFRDKSSP